MTNRIKYYIFECSKNLEFYINGMKNSLLQQKMLAYTAPQEVMKAGIYPYFKVIESGKIRK